MSRAFGVVLILFLACCSSSTQPPAGGAGGIGGGSGGSGGAGGAPCPDRDGDGHLDATCGGDDCNDGDPDTYPGAREICRDGLDQNCDKVPDDGCDCSLGDVRACWNGDAARRGVGICSDGTQRCDRYGVFGACTGEVDPTAEPPACDGIDQDCDGSDVPACKGCLDHEICGNGIDDDCNGVIDDPTFCATSCQPSTTPLPDYLACCNDGARHSFTCVDAPGFATCDSTSRLCLDLDGDPSTVCVKRCAGDGTCVCGAPADGSPMPSPGCGFETPCNRMGCENRQGQACYSGAPATLGVGLCHGGTSSCQGGAWGSCDGEVTPAPEVCGNGQDDDCDGLIDEDDGAGHRCPRTDCADAESCEDGTDNNCNGLVDEGCPAQETRQDCYSGPVAAIGIGICKQGVQTKQADGFWGPCVGEVLPAAERCGDGIDSSCNGRGGPDQTEDEGCCQPSGPEICNGKDDDCDGIADEGLLNSCGTCDVSCGATLSIDAAGDCSLPGRTCERLEMAAGGGIEVNPDAPLQETDNGLYFMVPTGIRRVDTTTGLTDWEVPGYTTSSSVYVGASVDGSLWISDYNARQLLHVGAGGKTLCSYSIPLTMTFGTPAPDENGTAWVVGYDATSARLLAFPGDSADATVTPPACLPRILGADGVSPGLVLDIAGVSLPAIGPPPTLWLAGYPTGLLVDRVTLEQKHITMPSSYGLMGVGMGGDVWMSTYGASGYGLLHIPAGDDGTGAKSFTSFLYNLVNRDDGLIWGIASPSYTLSSFDPATSQVTGVTPPDGVTGVYDLAADARGRLWMTGYSSSSYLLVSYDPDRKKWTSYTDQVPGYWSYSGQSNRTAAGPQRFARYRGSWTQDVDGGSNFVTWTNVTLDADLPAGSSLEVTIKAADRAENLATKRGCGPFTTSNIDLSGCLGGDPVARFLRVKVALRGTSTASPLLRSVKLDYQHP